MILARRGGQISLDPTIVVHTRIIPLPVKVHERNEFDQLVLRSLLTVAYLLFAFVVYAKIRAVRDQIRVVHAHYILPQGLFGLILSRLLRVPLVVSAVGQDVNEDMKNVILGRISCFVLSRATVTIAVSRPLKRVLERHGITNCVYLPNSVDTDSFRPRDEALPSQSVLFVGSMTERKRPLCLLRAFEKVIAAVPEATLVMVGSGPLKQLTLEEIGKKKLSDKVKLYPHVSFTTLQELLSRAAVFVLPSQYEGLSLALLEAMSAGKVIVASANQSNSDILQHGSNALLFPPDNGEELAKQIVSALKNKQLCLKLSRSARALCLREFSNNVVGPRLEEIYLKTPSRVAPGK
jgi:glycosyltransferase involved in cell wall biosynthesis